MCLFINVVNLLSVVIFFLYFHLINIIFVLDEHYISNIKSVTCSISTLELDIRMDGWIDR